MDVQGDFSHLAIIPSLFRFGFEPWILRRSKFAFAGQSVKRRSRSGVALARHGVFLPGLEFDSVPHYAVEAPDDVIPGQ
jgi:hypothetical protein